MLHIVKNDPEVKPEPLNAAAQAVINKLYDCRGVEDLLVTLKHQPARVASDALKEAAHEISLRCCGLETDLEILHHRRSLIEVTLWQLGKRDN